MLFWCGCCSLHAFFKMGHMYFAVALQNRLYDDPLKLIVNNAKDAFNLFMPVHNLERWCFFLIDLKTDCRIPFPRIRLGMDIYINMCQNAHIEDPTPNHIKGEILVAEAV